MTKEELRLKLKELKLPDGIYSLEGKLVPAGIIYDDTQKNKWRVFNFDERGNYHGDQTFFSEEKACDYFMELANQSLMLLPKNR